MGIAYQATFFVALTLLAIVITIFVFAVSLLGRAMEAAAKSEKEKTTERKAKNAEEMATIKEEIEKAEANGQIPKGLTRKLNKLEKRDKEFEKELAKTRRAPELLTAKGGVAHPVAFLIGALILIGVAWGISEINSPVPTVLWILGLAAIVYSGVRMYRSLKVVESVAITSEEAALIREKKALKMALREHEEEKKLKLQLEFLGEQPPLHVKAGSTRTIEFYLRIVKGIEATNPKAIFYAPPGFGFPGHETYKQPDASSSPNYITTEINVEDVHKGLRSGGSFTLKAPTKPNSFTIFYRIIGTGFSSKKLWFQVIVE